MGKLLLSGFTTNSHVDFEFSCPGGESVQDMCARVDSVVAKVGPSIECYASLMIFGRFESTIDSTSKRARGRATF